MRTLLLMLLLALAGCQTLPENQPSLLSPMPEDGRGRIVVRPFFVPVSVGSSVFAVVMGGGSSGFKATLYDVTGQPRYLGEMVSHGVLNNMMGPIQNAFEFDVEPGKRVLMMHTRRFGGGDILDFAEVTVGANRIEHVPISQYGMNDRPFLVNLALDQRASRYCGYTKGLKYSEVEKWFKDQGIPETRPATATQYCHALSTITRVRTVQDPPWPAAPTKEQVAALRDKYLPVWRVMPDKTPPYDVVQPIVIQQVDHSKGNR